MKKGMIFLYMMLGGFILAVALFYGAIGHASPGGQTLYLGENEIALYETYFNAEKDIYYLELSAIQSAKQASKENFETSFKSNFETYLTNSQMEIEDFEFTYKYTDDSVIIIALTEEELVYTNTVYTYSIKPNFRIEVPQH